MTQEEWEDEKYQVSEYLHIAREYLLRMRDNVIIITGDEVIQRLSVVDAEFLDDLIGEMTELEKEMEKL